MQRDAIVINTKTGNVCYDIDPLPLEDMGGGLIDCGDFNAIDLMEACELAAQESTDTQEYTVVWADDRSSPVFDCPIHDHNDFPRCALRDATIIEAQEEGEASELACLRCM